MRSIPADEQWLDTMAVNVNALFYLSRAAVKHMKAAGKGAIVNVASEWGLNGEANSCGLLRQQGSGDSDHPLHGLGSCARQYPRQFGVPRRDSHPNGRRHSRQARRRSRAHLRDLAAGIPMRRLAHPTEVARCVHFLASDLASYVTGTNLSVDGGNDATAVPTLETDTARETDPADPSRMRVFAGAPLRIAGQCIRSTDNFRDGLRFGGTKTMRIAGRRMPMLIRLGNHHVQAAQYQTPTVVTSIA